MGDNDLKVISTTENSNKFQKTIIGFPFIFGCPKNQYIHCETMFTCSVSLFLSRFTLGPMAQATLVSMKEGSLFCFVCTYEISSNLDASDCVLRLFRKLLRKRGASAWFH